jgi:iron complex transport system substrate-binding protein
MRHWWIALPLLLVAHAASADERSVTDDTGRSVQIPAAPQRIVVLHEPLLGLPLLDLGVEIVGSYGRLNDGKMPTAVDFIETVLGPSVHKPPLGIGPVGNIDLERLRELNPDLILGTERDANKVAQLTGVAPIYLQNVGEGRARGFSIEESLAKLLGRQHVFEHRHKTYREHLTALRASLPAEPAGRSYLMVMIHDQIRLVGEVSGAIQALEDLGYRRASFDKAGRDNGLGSGFAIPLDAELFGQINPDLLVIMSSYANRDRSEATIRGQLDRIVPGWEKFLAPAREKRILYVDSAKMATPTIASAEHMLAAYAAWAKR